MNIKEVVVIFTVLVVSLMSSNIAAQSTGRVVLRQVDDVAAVNIYIDLGEDLPYSVSLVNAKNEVLWKERSKSSEYAKTLRLDYYPEGTYRVLVSSNNRHFQNAFRLGHDEIQVGEDETTLIAPTVTVRGRTVLVDFDDNTMDEEVHVRIFDQSRNEVFANKITTDERRITRYDISSLLPGDYIMEFEIKGKRFSRSIRVR